PKRKRPHRGLNRWSAGLRIRSPGNRHRINLLQPESEGTHMSKSVAIRSVDEGEPSPPTASGLRRFFRTYWKMLLAILSAVVVAVAIIVIFTGLPPPPPSPGPEVFVRDVYIL